VVIGFNTDGNGSLKQKADDTAGVPALSFLVKKTKTFNEIQDLIPGTIANKGKVFKEWKPALPKTDETVKDGTVATANFADKPVTGDVIPFVPADPKNPADPKDPHTPKTDGNNEIDRDEYVVIGFNTDGNGSLKQKADDTAGVPALSFLVKKTKTFNEIQDLIPGTIAKENFTFDKWDPALPKTDETVKDGTVATAKFKPAETPKLDKPTIDKITEGDDSFKVGPPTGATTITITIPGNDPIVVTKDGDTWKVGDTPVTVDDKGHLVIPVAPEKVKKGDVITVTAEDGKGGKSEETTEVQPKPTPEFSKEDIIPFIPTDPKNPADPKDPKTPSEDNTGKKINRDEYVVIGFTTDGNGSLKQKADDTAGVPALSFLVKKTKTFNEVQDLIPGTIAKENFTFDKWDPALPKTDAPVADGTVAKAIFKNAGGSTLQPPTVEKITEGDGSILVGPPAGATTITITIPGNDPIVVIKDGDTWKVGDTPVTVDDKGHLVIPVAPEKVKKGDVITVTAEDGKGGTSTTEKKVEPKKPDAPSVDKITEGDNSVKVGEPAYGDKITIEYPNGGGTVEVTRGNDGTWSVGGTPVTKGEDGKLVIPVDPTKFKAGDPITVTVTNGDVPSDSTTVTADPKPVPGNGGNVPAKPDPIAPTKPAKPGNNGGGNGNGKLPHTGASSVGAALWAFVLTLLGMCAVIGSRKGKRDAS
ncbi:hypothetical protein, partial [Trueperella sp. LYQ143]|uniref:hypothetical protein n=1 Tax=Trueperella sp. LYQ143 TaxID=3391059 RepID=UPI0039830F66